MDKILLSPAIICRLSVRYFGKHNKRWVYKDGVRYGKILYYPRDPDHKDPPIEPSKLFMVKRIKPYKGIPFWEKRIIRDLGIDESTSEIAIVKNTPEMNTLLWKVKHLVKITPITFPYGEPTEEDINYTFLKETGECIVAKEIKVDDSRLQATEKFVKDQKRLDMDTLKRDSRLKWLNPW
ncbi:39S ribosomal protein L30, mitochondrial [Phlebotomus papatasi]|uniref:39S ribosomal protein L30, mitochondrial n=1 Tax=Phlebotomus papatasi TaxID=29031 RepID=UPI00248447B1|nr:39S ribosomal protein L30, mitochondrial [Phlebotomus papatasi]